MVKQSVSSSTQPTLEKKMMPGLSKSSKTQEIVEQVSEKLAFRYRVVREEINLEQLRREKDDLQAQLNMPEPSKEELIEAGRMMHPFYQSKEWLERRIAEIDGYLKAGQ